MAKGRKPKERWIQGARERMEEKGTEGKFGKTTAKKVAAAKKKGGVAEKRAVFAQNMKRIAEKRKGTHVKERSGRTAKYMGKKTRKRGSGKR